MIISWNWMGDYVRLDMSADALAQRLALSGLNHESTSDVGGDLAIDLEVTSNRPDCLSHLGVAREVAALYGKAVCEPDPRPVASGEHVDKYAKVEVEYPEACPRFTARVIRGVRLGPSPWWLRKRLETVGIKPISNVVDVTNYVMMECGQPLHAYDLGRLKGSKIVVRRGLRGETFKAINGKDYELDPAMLVIADAERPVGLAGVMGGLDTEIGESTRDVLIEAALFDFVKVRHEARKFSLFSEASRRFERAMDPARVEWAGRRAADLILQLAGGTLAEGMIDVGTSEGSRPPVSLRLAQIRRILGIDVPGDRVAAILGSLGLRPLDASADVLSFEPPSWRADLTREIDLIEEVARIHGYEQIPEDRPVPMARSRRGPRERVEDAVRGALTGMGFSEAATYSLVAEDLAGPVDPADADGPPLRVDHSSRRKEDALRQSIAPSLLAARASNEARGNTDAELFEVAHVYLPRAGSPLPGEPPRLAIVSGRDYVGMKGVVEALLGALHVEGELAATSAVLPGFVVGRTARLSIGGAPLGVVGEVDERRLDALGLRSPASAAELDFDGLQAASGLIPTYRPTPPYPAVARDLSLVADRSVTWAELSGIARVAAGPNLEALTYLDTFRGGDLPEDRQSVHFSLRFRHPSRTLAGPEVEGAVADVVAACASRLGATIR